ncbi:transposase [Planctomicrobium sp. SH668]|uniref:transposase n=1 Tax=Planctomicrobium sp. SH668 TaxID=3448126 RepID=UPI003F5BC777
MAVLRSIYSSNLSDEQWQLIRRYLPKRPQRGRSRIDRRWILDAILFVVGTRCQRQMLPGDFPGWSTVYGIFRAMQKTTWFRLENWNVSNFASRH